MCDENTSVAKPAGEIVSVNSYLKDFSGFENTRILSENTQAKTINLLGNFQGKSGQAIVLLQKSCFIHDHLPNLLTGKTILNKQFDNDIYGTYDCQPPPELNGITATIIHPATEKHIAKYEAKPHHVIEETPALYQSVTLPHLKAEQFNLQWVYNIIEGTAEQDRVVYASPSSEEKTGFILVPDLKWDGKNLENLHLIAIPYSKGILSLRDLTSDHLPLLLNIDTQGKKAIEEKFGLPASQLRIFFHYQPSFYHLHIHFTSLRHEAFGIHAGKAHLLTSVINNLELLSTYYQKATLPFFLKESDNLFSKFEEHGIVRKFELNPTKVESGDGKGNGE
ncbi:m7GpppX diphosphatase [Ischnura elegans]|uniref:m7GpppX diphosphatase n=1 Tax=Ischnura elegans TaxID=197161 RepID=UPI001ED8A63C|nr:m7GpppX diphosphatase [Ischnura elegans]